MDKKFKVGDVVRCIPGFVKGRDGYPDSGGAGYVVDRVITINELTTFNNYQICWGHPSGGVYSQALELVHTDVVINNYELY